MEQRSYNFTRGGLCIDPLDKQNAIPVHAAIDR